MDPVSVVGLVGSTIGIVEIIGRSLLTLYDIKERLKGADLTLSTLIAELTTTRAALNQIQSWIDEKLKDDSQHFQLIMDLESTLTNCRLLVGSIDMHVTEAQGVGSAGMSFEKRLRAVRSEQNTRELLDRLSRVVGALNCLISAFNARGLEQQRIVLYEKDTRYKLDQMSDDSSSLVALYDGSSLRTKTTTATSKLSLRFDFDSELLKHKNYQNTFRALIRRARAGRDDTRLGDSSSAEAAKSSAEIDESLQKDAKALRREVKILVTGDAVVAANAIISIKSIAADVPSQEGGSSCQITVVASVIRKVQNLLDSVDLDSEDSELQAAVELIRHMDPLADSKHLPEDAAKAIRKVWKAASLEPNSFERMRRLGWISNENYFKDLLKRLEDPEYIPCDLDLFLCSIPANGATETKLNLDELDYNFTLLPNLSFSSRKFIHQWENVSNLLYCVDLLSYGKQMFQVDDTSATELDEELTNFDDIVNSRWFKRTGVILVLYNMHLFKSELERRPLETYFPDYEGGPDVTRAAKYLLWRFSQLNKAGLSLYPHLTDSGYTVEMPRFVLAAVKETIHSTALRDSGILSVEYGSPRQI